MQLADDASVVPSGAPEKDKLLDPETAVIVPPVQVVAAAGVLAILNPLGKLSTKPTLVINAAFAVRVSVTVKRTTEPAVAVLTEKALLTLSGAVTDNEPMAIARLFPNDVVSPFTAMVLVREPVVAVGSASTPTVIVHVPGTLDEAAAGIAPPLIVIDVLPVAAVKLPPQVLEGVTELATVKPDPNVVSRSVKLVMVAVAPTCRLVSVMISVETPVRGIDVSEKAFDTDTEDTSRVAEALT